IEALKMRTLMELTRGAERIVELGAGWGKNLFKLWLYGAPLDAEYHALELTPEARNLAKRVAQSAAPKMPFFTHAFDYYRPDFSMFAEAKPTVVFSHHSLEQIPSVGERLFEAIKGIPGLIRVVHLEPVGFQVPGATWLENVRPDRMEYIDSLNRAFATKRDQNLNLYPILRSMELEGSIRLTRVRKHFCSILLKNATTLLVWEPNGTPSLTTPETQRDDLQEPPPQPSVWTRLRRKVGKRILGETNAGSQIH
ncbi:MAG: class I SAM-dependent methyltransferase, partial [Bdellovibrionales bacterium]|nr:class I SAM-dependent methyltransferase [Bdellovibrionales bacterium]